MTVIAFDGVRLAADRRSTHGSLIRHLTKIHTIGEVFVAHSGDAAEGRWMLEWYRQGAKAAEFPEFQKNTDRWAPLHVFFKDGVIHAYERSPYPIIYPPQMYATGSGRDFALMAMRLGKSPKEAVELTIEFDSGCGNGVDTLQFDDSKAN